MLTTGAFARDAQTVPILETADLTVGYESLGFTIDGNLRGVIGLGRRYYPVLNALSCELSFAGGVATIVGANGTGKTTFLKAVAGIVPSSGDVIWAGRPIGRLSQHERLALGIAYVPYERGLFPSLTIDEHLTLVAPRAEARAAVLDELTERVRTLDATLVASLGFITRGGTRTGNLSGGERRLLSLARLLFGKWSLILVDEPTAGLSPASLEIYFTMVSMLQPAMVLQAEQYSRGELHRRRGSTLFELQQSALTPL